MLVYSLSHYRYFKGFCNAPFIFRLFFLPRNLFSAAGVCDLLVASLTYRHEAVGISGQAGKSKEQDRAANGCCELHRVDTKSDSI